MHEPDNKEYEEIYQSLTEAITLTEELLKEAGQPSATGIAFSSDILTGS